MKKISLLISVIVMCTSCRTHITCFGDYTYPTQSTGITLNGIDENTAKSMQTNFVNLRNQDIRPTRQSIWFDRVTFHHIVMLLIKEKGGKETLNHPDVLDKTDGVRIYFVSASNLKYGHLINSITLVSTKNEGPEDPQYPGSYQYHKDYYNHDMTDSLFMKPVSIMGTVEIRPLLNINQGQNLYNIRIAKRDSTPSKNPHYISRAKGRVMANYFGKDPITTESEWFDLKLLVALDSVPHDGIRIYFARHRALYIGGKSDPDALREAFVLLPTVSNGNHHKDSFVSKGLDFYSLKTATAKNKAKAAPRGIFTPLVDTLGGFDNGEICPTHCN